MHARGATVVGQNRRGARAERGAQRGARGIAPPSIPPLRASTSAARGALIETAWQAQARAAAHQAAMARNLQDELFNIALVV